MSGAGRKTFSERIATSESHKGRALPVEVNTHVAGTLEFESGAIASLITSFDIWGHNLPPLQVHGSEGSLSVQSPNLFSGEVSLLKAGAREWKTLPYSHSVSIGRGAGVADMAMAIQSGRPHRASGALAFHVLDIMCALEESAAAGRRIDIRSTVEQPLALPVGLADGELDA